MITAKVAPNDLGLFSVVWKAFHPGCADAKIVIDYQALVGYTLKEIEWALTEHQRDLQEGKYPAQPAHLIGHLNRRKSEQKAQDNFYKAEKEEWKRTPEGDAIAAANLKKIYTIIKGMTGVVALPDKYKR